ncbi:MAG TPA: DUF1707 domain-containing protein [Conexibacter sp.]|nr:DUF1707 domain-containing protein [Conexibacter sp.]
MTDPAPPSTTPNSAMPPTGEPHDPPPGARSAAGGQAHDAPSPALDRSAAIAQLTRHATAGELTLAEYAEIAAAIEAATTPAQLEAAVAPVSHEPPAPVPTPGRTLVGVFGGTDQRGRWRLPRRLRILAVFGGVSADLGSAQVETAISTITVLAVFGGVSLTAPTGVSVQLSGASLLGGKSDKRPVGPPLPGSPLIHVRAYTLLGGVAVERAKPREPER